MKVTKLNIHNNNHMVWTRTVAQNDIIWLENLTLDLPVWRDSQSKDYLLYLYSFFPWQLILYLLSKERLNIFII